MKLYLLIGTAIMSLAMAACGPPSVYKQPVFPVCEGRVFSSLGPLSAIYSPATVGSCKQVFTARDVAAWVESPINSHRLRGLQTLVLGCANLTSSAESCEYGGPEGHAATLDLAFDFTHFSDRIRVRKAVLAVYAQTNASFLTEAVQLRGRLLPGDPYQSLAQNRVSPGVSPGWIQFDITDLAARAIVDRRTSVNFELALPCSRDENNLSVVGVLKPEPVIIVEYL